MKKKQRRILDRDRVRNRARRIINRWYDPKQEKDKIYKTKNPKIQDGHDPAIFAEHLKMCSCWMCGNPRKYFNEKTLQELKYGQNPEKELHDEYNLIKENIKSIYEIVSIDALKTCLAFIDLMEKHYIFPDDIKYEYYSESTISEILFVFYSKKDSNKQIVLCFNTYGAIKVLEYKGLELLKISYFSEQLFHNFLEIVYNKVSNII